MQENESSITELKKARKSTEKLAKLLVQELILD